jgi:hypothetical protein
MNYTENMFESMILKIECGSIYGLNYYKIKKRIFKIENILSNLK